MHLPTLLSAAQCAGVKAALTLVRRRKLEVANGARCAAESDGPLSLSCSMPSIYYIGVGKTGSIAIKMGFPGAEVAHWHSENYFEWVYGTKVLTRANASLLSAIWATGAYGSRP